MRSPYLRATGMLILALSIVACRSGSNTSELAGKVTYKGSPLTQGEVYLKAEDGREFSNTINPDGTYSIKNLPRGMYKVRILCIDQEGYTEFNKALAGRGKGEPIGPD